MSITTENPIRTAPKAKVLSIVESYLSKMETEEDCEKERDFIFGDYTAFEFSFPEREDVTPLELVLWLLRNLEKYGSELLNNLFTGEFAFSWINGVVAELCNNWSPSQKLDLIEEVLRNRSPAAKSQNERHDFFCVLFLKLAPFSGLEETLGGDIAEGVGRVWRDARFQAYNATEETVENLCRLLRREIAEQEATAK